MSETNFKCRNQRNQKIDNRKRKVVSFSEDTNYNLVKKPSNKKKRIIDKKKDNNSNYSFNFQFKNQLNDLSCYENNCNNQKILYLVYHSNFPITNPIIYSINRKTPIVITFNE